MQRRLVLFAVSIVMTAKAIFNSLAALNKGVVLWHKAVTMNLEQGAGIGFVPLTEHFCGTG